MGVSVLCFSVWEMHLLFGLSQNNSFEDSCHSFKPAQQKERIAELEALLAKRPAEKVPPKPKAPPQRPKVKATAHGSTQTEHLPETAPDQSKIDSLRAQIQKLITSFEYNHTGVSFFQLRRDRGMKHLVNTAKNRSFRGVMIPMHIFALYPFGPDVLS